MYLRCRPLLSAALGTFKYTSREVDIPQHMYTVKASRGGGPGGQGVNCSANKAELRLNVSGSPPPGIDEDTWNKFKQQQQRNISSGGYYICSSHEERSLNANIDRCLKKVRDGIVQASFVEQPPLPKPTMAPWTKEKAIQDKKRSGTKAKFRMMKDL